MIRAGVRDLVVDVWVDGKSQSTFDRLARLTIGHGGETAGLFHGTTSTRDATEQLRRETQLFSQMPYIFTPKLSQIIQHYLLVEHLVLFRSFCRYDQSMQTHAVEFLLESAID